MKFRLFGGLHFVFCVIDLQLLKTMKIANVQIFVQKRGLASNFFSLVLSNISRVPKYWISGHLEECILCNWSPTFENHENCKCANFCAKKGFSLQFFFINTFQGRNIVITVTLTYPYHNQFHFDVEFLDISIINIHLSHGTNSTL